MYNKHLIICFLFLIFVNVSICLQPGPLAFSARRTELIESQSCERSGWSCKDCSTLQSCSQNNIFKFQISCADQFPDRPYCDPKLGVCSSDRHVCSEMKDPEFICPDVGIYPDLTDCRRYISCRAKGEIGLIYSCLFQSVFNAKLKRCITNSNCYDPIIECNGQYKTMAYAPDPSLYIVCRGDQKPLIKDCGSKRMEYDPTLLACDFKCKDEGRFAHPSNNTLYYVCIYNGNKIVRMMGLCLPGTVFDEYYATCVYDFKTTTQLVTELQTVTEEILLETTTEYILETTPFEANTTTIVNEEIVENTETINSTENGNKSNYINRNIETFSETHFFEKLVDFTTENGPTTIEDEINSETTTLNEQNTESNTNTETILDSTTNYENLTEMTAVNTEETTNTEIIAELTTNNENLDETTVVNEQENTEAISDITTNNEDSETTTENTSLGQETSTAIEQTTSEEATTTDTNENIGNTTNSLETTEKNDTQEETTEDITKEDESNEKTEENTKEDETTEKQSNEDDNDATNEKTEEDTKEDVEDETTEKSNEDGNDTNENTEENTKEDEDEDNSKESKENNSHANKSKEKSNESKDKKHKCKGIRCIAEWKIPGFLKRRL